MNNHDNHLPDYREIMKYEGKIVLLFNHNVHKYKYVGEEGKEYEVIQSIFNEINHLPGLSNKHIRWYAIIINLRTSFQNRRTAAKLMVPPYMGLIELLRLDIWGVIMTLLLISVHLLIQPYKKIPPIFIS